MSAFPYDGRFPIHRQLPDEGTPRGELLAMLHTIATEEDASWESGKCSGTMYCGDHDHYRFMNEAFGLFAHVNVLQRDLCPSATKFEAEIIAMTLDLLHAEAVDDGEPAGLVSTGGTGSICHAMLAYREFASQQRGIRRPNVIKPETAHPAFDKACHLFGIDLRVAPIDPVTTQVDTEWVDDHIDEDTVAIIGSACNYGSAPSTRSERSPTSPFVGASVSMWTAAWEDSSCPSVRSSDTTSRCSTTAIRG